MPTFSFGSGESSLIRFLQKQKISSPKTNKRIICAPRRRKLCFTEDEGRPLGAAMRMEASNHLKLLWPKAMVVSVKEKVLLERIR
jgi:hypothetical protein